MKNNEIEPRRGPENEARRKAAALLPHLQALGVGKMSNPDGIGEKILARRILENRPISFVGFWGVGEKVAPDAIDEEYVRSIKEKRNNLGAAYSKGTDFTFILADLHGVFNGFLSPDGNSPYLDRVQVMLREAGFSSIRLSDLYEKHGLDLPDSKNPINPINEAYHVYRRQAEQYVNSARKHHNGAGDEAGGYWYVAMRLQERTMLKEAFPDSFILVNGYKMTAAPLMPKTMPVIYLPEGPVWFRKNNNGSLPSEARV